MTRVVESVVAEFGKKLMFKKVVTKTTEGAKRYLELVQCTGRQLPVPSIIINNKLAFETIPGVQELKAHLNDLINQSD